MAGTETLTRTVETTTENQVSKAIYKGFNLTFTEDRVQGTLIKLTITGFKQTGQQPNVQSDSVSFNYDEKFGGKPSITFTPSTAFDADVAAALNAEFNSMKAPVEA